MRHIFLILLSFFLTSCNQKTENHCKNLNQFDWLIGQWKNKTNDFYFNEKWWKTKGNDLKGEAFILVGFDTVFQENMLIEKVKDSVF